MRKGQDSILQTEATLYKKMERPSLLYVRETPLQELLIALFFRTTFF